MSSFQNEVIVDHALTDSMIKAMSPRNNPNDNNVDLKENTSVGSNSRGEVYSSPPNQNQANNVQIGKFSPKEDRFMHNQTEQNDRLANKTGRTIYSSTSSVYAEHTISDPNNDQVIYCIAAVLQAQMFDDIQNEEFSAEGHPYFNFSVQLPVEYGGDRDEIPEEILKHETLNDNELRVLLLNKSLPTVDTMYRFFKYLMLLTDYTVECNIIALVYINRITVKNRIAITMENWRGLWLGAIILAQKVWDDKPLKTTSFSTILTNTSKERLIEVEMKVFELLNYSATVRPSVYAKYFFELHELFLEITGSNSKTHAWHLQPLTLAEMKKLELRSGRHGGNRHSRHSSHHHSRSHHHHHSSSSTSGVSSSSSRNHHGSSSATNSPRSGVPSNATSSATHKSGKGSKTATKSQDDAVLSPKARTLEDATYSSLSRYVIN